MPLMWFALSANCSRWLMRMWRNSDTSSHVVGLETIAIDHSIGLYARPDDREERFRSNVWDDHRMDLAAPLKQAEDGNLAASAAPPFALAPPAEIPLIDLHPAPKQSGRLLIQALSDHFPQFAEE